MASAIRQIRLHMSSHNVNKIPNSILEMGWFIVDGAVIEFRNVAVLLCKFMFSYCLVFSCGEWVSPKH